MRSILSTATALAAGILFSYSVYANGQPQGQKSGLAAQNGQVSSASGQIPGENLDALYEIPENRKSGKDEGEIKTLKAEDGITYKLVP